MMRNKCKCGRGDPVNPTPVSLVLTDEQISHIRDIADLPPTETEELMSDSGEDYRRRNTARVEDCMRRLENISFTIVINKRGPAEYTSGLQQTLVDLREALAIVHPYN